MTTIPRIYLNMIVKNESKVILRLLQSVLPLIDGYCICDTGSTDNTIELIRTFFETANLRGIIVSEPFRDFGYNRTFALKAALTAPGITENDYLLLMDADMVLTGPILTNPEDFKKALTHDVYLLMQGSDTFYYKNARIVKNKGYSYWGVTHEYLNTLPGSTYYTIEKPLLFIQDIGDGGSKSDKWERDIRLLTQGLAENPTSERYAFYLANTYRDSGNHLKAIEYYKKRIQMGGWIEEVWQSYFSAGKCYMAISDFPNALNMWLDGYQTYPNRIENLYFIINYYRNNGKNRLAYQFYKSAKDSMKRFGGASDEFLFLEKDIYEYKLDYEMTILGYYENPDKLDLKNLSMKVLSNKLIEDGISKNILSNYKFYTEKAISVQSSLSNNNTLTTLLNQVGFTIHTNLSDNSLTGLYPSSPSLTFLNNNILLVNKRYVNYQIDNAGNYINQDHIISKNVITVIDISDSIVKYEKILDYDTSLDNTYVGLEDIRLHVGHDGQIYYNANRGISVSNIQIEHGMIDIQDDTIIRTVNNRIIESPNNRRVEKNWILFNSSQDQPRCIYGFYPLTIGHIQDNQFIPVYQQTNLPAFFKHVRGSTNGVQINGDEIWFIGHIVSYESRRYYYHIVIVLDKSTGALKRYTNMFTFEGQPVEYTLGFVEIGSNLLIGYSILDKETKFMEVPKEWFEKQMI